MPDIFDLIARWRKQIFIVIFLSLLIVGVITFLKPRKYLSIATAVPASSLASDKARIFNENIQELYSTLGTPDDLDRIIGTANLDTVYNAVAQQFNLEDHYKINGDDAAGKSAITLKGNTQVMKSEYGELKVKLWDTDKNLAPQLANAIMDKLNNIHQSVQTEGNVVALNNLLEARTRMMHEADSLTESLLYDSVNSVKISHIITTENKRSRVNRRNSLLQQLPQYEKLITEYQLMAYSKSPALLVIEKAKPATRPDKPKRLQIMIVTAVLSFLFALLAALVMERRKNSAQ